MVTTPRVVIIGAGFGGLTAARTLAGTRTQVTLIDQHNFHTFSPLLYEVATAGIGPDDIAPSVRGVVRGYSNVEFHMARVASVDFDGRRVRLAEGDPIAYDYLVLAAGAVSSDFGVPGVREHALPLKSLEDATRVRSMVLQRFEATDRDPSLVEEGELRVVVVGGGPTGVELCGALAELFTKVLARDFHGFDIGRAEVVCVEGTGALLGAFSPKSQAEARRELEARGVNVRLDAMITAVDADGVSFVDGTRLATKTVIWCAGVKANPLADRLGLPQSKRGEIEVRDDLTVADHPEVFVIGDLGAARDRRGRPYPQLAPVAMQQARHVARGILRRERGKKIRRFRYVDKGSMATIGRRSAVAELPFRIRLGGTLGWLSWLGLHLVFLIGFRNRLVVLVNWVWNYFTFDRGNRIIIPPEPSTTRRDDSA
ncbi:MAG TPA: NAD(P)/FAD-dependent oxidoreductase [Acidimicrobiia bacterium]|nr:NAD(P)/FAD-dependent oxidoreductase [Acidimicrobiia bacterium]